MSINLHFISNDVIILLRQKATIIKEENHMKNSFIKPEFIPNCHELCDVMSELSAYTENKNVLIHSEVHRDFDRLSPIPDFMVKNFSTFKMKKLCIADFPLPESLDTWYTMYKNAYYEITASDRDVTENPDVTWESLSHLYNSYEWNIELNNKNIYLNPAELVKDSDLVISFTAQKNLRTYLDFLSNLEAKYLIGCCVHSLKYGSLKKDISETSAHIYKVSGKSLGYYTSLEACHLIVWLTNIELPAKENQETADTENSEITMDDIFTEYEDFTEVFSDEDEHTDDEKEDDCYDILFGYDCAEYEKAINEMFAEEDEETPSRT